MERRSNLEDQIKQENRYELGTWGFLQLGWWVLHIVAVVAVFYLGYLYGAAIFR
jgi:hypothetical protein